MKNNQYKMLLVEDEKNICSLIETILEANGYHPLIAGTCKQGLMMFASYTPDLVLLDLGLPDRDGIELIRAVRKTSNVPIIVLSARSTESDKITALDCGANDYITKPFSTGELLARVRAALRVNRYNAPVGENRFTLHELTIDYDSRVVTIAGEEVRLTQTEYNILAFLAQHAGKVMTYSAILKKIWGDTDDGNVKKLQVNMANIRRKLGIRPGDNRYIINELGVGYRMNE